MSLADLATLFPSDLPPVFHQLPCSTPTPTTLKGHLPSTRVWSTHICTWRTGPPHAATHESQGCIVHQTSVLCPGRVSSHPQQIRSLGQHRTAAERRRRVVQFGVGPTASRVFKLSPTTQTPGGFPQKGKAGEIKAQPHGVARRSPPGRHASTPADATSPCNQEQASGKYTVTYSACWVVHPSEGGCAISPSVVGMRECEPDTRW